MRQKWEYLTCTVSMTLVTPDIDAITKELGVYGDKGWELCGFTPLLGAVPRGWVLLCVFKREA